MAEGKETRFKKKVMAMLNELPRCWYLKSQEVSRSGTPDILACINGKFVALELKASPKAKVAELQKYTLNRIGDAKGISLLTYPENWDETYGYVVQECLKGVPLDELTIKMN